MPKLVVIVLLVGAALAGLLQSAARLIQWKKKKSFAEDYLAKFRQLVQHEPFDNDLYVWLVHRSARMQQQLGSLGMTARAATPYEPRPIPDHAVLINTLPEIRSGTARPAAIATCEEAIVRHLGLLDESRADYGKHLINPIVWLGDGVRFLFLLPLLVLQWLGLLKGTFVASVAKSTLFSVLSGLVALLGLIASVLILVLGWQRFTELLGLFS